LSAIVAKGVNRIPERIRFTTYTLRYNEMSWVCVDGLEKHWERAQVNADIVDDHTIEVETQNVSQLTLDMPDGLCPLDPEKNPKVVIDFKPLVAPGIKEDGSWTVHFAKEDGRWIVVEEKENTLRKVHGLQGPIDDGFLEGFVMVTPTGKPMASQEVANWLESEQEDAVYQWLMQFRGQPRVKTDVEVTDEDIAQYNLILWGDPESNAIFQKIADKLPIGWSEKEIAVGKRTFAADQNVPVMIFPNPLNPQRYVVINSGFTFIPYGSASNAQQTPKLPDWAILDITVPATKRIPEGVVAGDFFDENWKLV